MSGNNLSKYHIPPLWAMAVAAALFLLIPQVMWWLETLRYRLWFDADPSPSFYATAVYAVIKYGCFGLGCVMLIAVLVRLF